MSFFDKILGQFGLQRKMQQPLAAWEQDLLEREAKLKQLEREAELKQKERDAMWKQRERDITHEFETLLQSQMLNAIREVGGTNAQLSPEIKQALRDALEKSGHEDQPDQ